MSQIAFDIGNVVCDLNLNTFTDKLMELNVVESADDGMRILVEIQHAQDIGLITLEGYLRDTLKVKKDLVSELMESWFNTIAPNNTMINLINELETRGAEVALLSNIGYDHMNMLRNNYGDLFNKYIQHFSCEVGARKPSKLFYQSFLIENPKFDNCIYLDDIKENIDAANRAGFRAYVFELDKCVKNKSIKTEFNSILKNLWL